MPFQETHSAGGVPITVGGWLEAQLRPKKAGKPETFVRYFPSSMLYGSISRQTKLPNFRALLSTFLASCEQLPERSSRKEFHWPESIRRSVHVQSAVFLYIVFIVAQHSTGRSSASHVDRHDFSFDLVESRIGFLCRHPCLYLALPVRRDVLICLDAVHCGVARRHHDGPISCSERTSRSAS